MLLRRRNRGPRPIANPKKGRTRAEYNAYMAQYMRAYRQGGGAGRVQHRMSAADALYDPSRHGPLVARDLTGVLMGDPPVGRSALDQRSPSSIASNPV